MQLPRSKKLHAETSNRFIGNQRCRYRSASQQAEPAEASVSSWYTCCSHNTLLAMDWFLSGMSKGQQTHHSSQSPGQGTAPKSIPVPQLQGDPTFLYGGYGYRPPTFGYAWNGASQTTSMAQLPTDSSSTKAASIPQSTLSKSVSAPDLQNPLAMQELHKKKPQPQRQHSKLDGTPPVPRHNRHLTAGHALPSTPGEQSAANTPSSSRASTPPRRGAVVDSYWIGMAAA